MDNDPAAAAGCGMGFQPMKGHRQNADATIQRFRFLA
jgi:hypothetical protein